MYLGTDKLILRDDSNFPEIPLIESIPYQPLDKKLKLTRHRVRIDTKEALESDHQLGGGVFETDILGENYPEIDRYYQLITWLHRIISDHSEKEYQMCWGILSKAIRDFVPTLSKTDTLLHQLSGPENFCSYKRIKIMRAETSRRVWEVWCINFGFQRDGFLHPVKTPIHVHPAMSDNNFSIKHEDDQPYGYEQTFSVTQAGLIAPDKSPPYELKASTLATMKSGKVYYADDYEDSSLHRPGETHLPKTSPVSRRPHLIYSAGSALNIYSAAKPTEPNCHVLQR